MLLASKTHTAGDVRRWRVRYDKWLVNTATIAQINMQSSSTTCTVSNTSILGHEIIFFLNGGVLGETLTLTLVLADDLGNIKTDTIAFTVVAP